MQTNLPGQLEEVIPPHVICVATQMASTIFPLLRGSPTQRRLDGHRPVQVLPSHCTYVGTISSSRSTSASLAAFDCGYGVCGYGVCDNGKGAAAVLLGLLDPNQFENKPVGDGDGDGKGAAAMLLGLLDPNQFENKPVGDGDGDGVLLGLLDPNQFENKPVGDGDGDGRGCATVLLGLLDPNQFENKPVGDGDGDGDGCLLFQPPCCCCWGWLNHPPCCC
jgi:hypothetical protein